MNAEYWYNLRYGIVVELRWKVLTVKKPTMYMYMFLFLLTVELSKTDY